MSEKPSVRDYELAASAGRALDHISTPRVAVKVKGKAMCADWTTTTSCTKIAREGLKFARGGPLSVRLTTSCLGLTTSSTHNNVKLFDFEARSNVYDALRLVCAFLACDRKKQIVEFFF